MPKRMLIVIPVYISNELHLEFSEKTIESIEKATHTNHTYEVLVISNYTKRVFKESVEGLSDNVVFREDNVLSGAWNDGIRTGIAEGFDYIFISNNDVIYQTAAFDNIVEFAEDHSEFSLMTSAEWQGKDSLESRLAVRDFLKDVPPGQGFDEHPHFSAFMVRPEMVEDLKKVEEGTKEPFPGFFDENYSPAYFEDGDMHQRLLRAGMKAGHTATSLFYHYGSRTIKTDGELDLRNNTTYEKNRLYFSEKWGFDPHSKVVEADDPLRFVYKGAFEPNE